MSADRDRILAAAQALHAQHSTAQPFGPLTDDVAPRDVGEAYAVQHAFSELRAGEKGVVAGYKIAATTRVMQQMLGLDEPLFGRVLAETLHRSPAVLWREDYQRLGIECEIAVELRDAIPPSGAPYRRKELERYIGAVMPAFEIIDDRHADYSNLPALLLTAIADNGWNAGVILGSAVESWQHLDLAASRGTLAVNNDVRAEGYGRDTMGHPFEALAWLVFDLAQRGHALKRGDVVMTGSIVATQFLQPGDHAAFLMDDLGEVRVRVE